MSPASPRLSWLVMRDNAEPSHRRRIEERPGREYLTDIVSIFLLGCMIRRLSSIVAIQGPTFRVWHILERNRWALEQRIGKLVEIARFSRPIRCIAPTSNIANQNGHDSKTGGCQYVTTLQNDKPSELLTEGPPQTLYSASS